MFPKLITRYVFFELTKIFLVSSFVFVGLMLIVGIADEAKQHSLGPEILVRLIPYILPRALMFAMPATCLFSVCVVFGRMAADNEIIAVKSMGLHQSVIIFPVLAISFLISLAAVWVNDVSFAWSYWGIKRIVLESSDKILYSVLKDQGSVRTKRFSIEVEGVDGRQLIRPVISTGWGADRFFAIAEEATLITDIGSNSLVFKMTRGAVLSDDKKKVSFHFPDYSHPIPLNSPEEIAKATGNPSHLYLSQISSEIAAQNKQLQDSSKADAIRASSQLIAGDMLGLNNNGWRYRLDNRRASEKRLSRLHVVPHRRWANGFSCLAFAMIGIPVALKLKTANYATSFGACFLPILTVYYPLFILGLNGAKANQLPSYAAWLGNIACGLIGAFLLARQFKR